MLYLGTEAGDGVIDIDTRTPGRIVIAAAPDKSADVVRRCDRRRSLLAGGQEAWEDTEATELSDVVQVTSWVTSCDRSSE